MTIMNDENYIKLLKLIEKNPELTQRELSTYLGISLGKVNYCIRALRDKGWIKWGNFSKNPNKMTYVHILTPLGMVQKLDLTVQFLRRKESEYEQLKLEIDQLQKELTAVDEKKPLNTVVYQSLHQ